MSAEQYSIESLLADESFIDFVKFGYHKERWQPVTEDSRYRDKTEEARHIIESLQFRAELPSKLTHERIRRNIDTRIANSGRSSYLYNHYSKQRNSRFNYVRKIWYAAAMIAVLVVASFTYFNQPVQQPQASVAPQLMTKSTQAGQKLTVYLPDGSQVKMNANSTITYPGIFAGNVRQVSLEGEAYFDVVENKKKPFIVKSGELSTQVYGTTFNVRNYDNDKETSVILETGRVQVAESSNKSKNNSQTIMLEPGTEVRYTRVSGRMQKSKANLDHLKWKDGVILFDKASRAEVFKKLEDWYGLKFDFTNFNDNNVWNYSARFDNKSLENVLKSIAYVKKFSYMIEDEKVIITK